MQLFITKPLVKNNRLIISEQRLIHQMGRVLRMKEGERCCIQHEEGGVVKRWTAKIISINKMSIETSIRECEESVKKEVTTSLLVAMPNKFSKIEMIVQKLSEIGIDEIVFWNAKRSLLKEINENKMKRLSLISKEAIEQSRGWSLPTIRVIQSLHEYGNNQKHFMICEIPQEAIQFEVKQPTVDHEKILCVGPEGGWEASDYEEFKEYSCSFLTLGKSTLRMETAAIIAGWHAKNTL